MKLRPPSPVACGFVASAALLLLAPYQFVQVSRADPAIAAFQSLREGGPQAIDRSLEGFRGALRHDPASPFRWCDLGEAYLAAGNLGSARYCFARGLDLSAETPAIQFRAANFYVSSGEPEKALPLMSRALRNNPNYADAVFSVYDRFAIGLADILKSGIPAEPLPARAWFEHVLKARESSDATETWRWMAAHSLTTDQQASEYVETLGRQRQYRAAALAWSTHMRSRSSGGSKDNLVLNGGFEERPGRMTSDWQIQDSGHAKVSRDCHSSHSGSCSLAIRFDSGAFEPYEGMAETLFVQPGSYTIEAYVRVNLPAGDQQVSIRVFDPKRPAALDVQTSSIAGSADWTHLQRRFTVPIDTYQIAIQLVRSGSKRFDANAEGAVWLDDVSLISSEVLSLGHERK